MLPQARPLQAKNLKLFNQTDSHQFRIFPGNYLKICRYHKKYSQKGCIEVFRTRQFMFKKRELVRKLVYFSYNVEIILFVFPIIH